MTLFYTVWGLVIIGILGWCIREETEPKVHHANEALVLFTQWQFQAESNVTWCREAEGFETWCGHVDLYQWNEDAEHLQQSEKWTAFHAQRLNKSLEVAK